MQFERRASTIPLAKASPRACTTVRRLFPRMTLACCAASTNLADL
jgi:hypothetical protein